MICNENFKVDLYSNSTLLIEISADVEYKDSQISQLEARLRKYDRDFVSGNLVLRETKFSDSISGRVTCHSRTVSRDTNYETEAMKQERIIYELKVKVKEQQIYIERLQRQLQKNVDALKYSTGRYF